MIPGNYKNIHNLINLMMPTGGTVPKIEHSEGIFQKC